jgi:hypothetical protein
MCRRRLALPLLLVACARAPEPHAAEQTTVEIPAAKAEPSSANRQHKEAPVPSSPDRAETAKPEQEPAEPDFDEPPPQRPPAWGPPGIGPTGGPDCDSLADCCLKAIHVAGVSTDPRVCDHMRKLPAMVCSQLLPQLIQEAAKHGISCAP